MGYVDQGVAPRAGAWIETGWQQSHHDGARSRPVRARGLKLLLHRHELHGAGVAPRAGAWIETANKCVVYDCTAGRAPCGRVD